MKKSVKAQNRSPLYVVSHAQKSLDVLPSFKVLMYDVSPAKHLMHVVSPGQDLMHVGFHAENLMCVASPAVHSSVVFD